MNAPSAILDQDEPVAIENRRRSERRPHVAEAWLASPTSSDPSDRLEVSSLNLSKHGIAFEVPVAIPTGSYYRLQLGMGMQRMTTEVRIISCRAGDASHYVGAEFC